MVKHLCITNMVRNIVLLSSNNGCINIHWFSDHEMKIMSTSDKIPVQCRQQTQTTFTCSKSKIETLKKVNKYVQS